MPLAGADLHCLVKARAPTEADLYTCFQALGYHEAVAETPQIQSFQMPPSKKRFIKCQIPRKLSRISVAQCKRGLGKGHERVPAKIPQNIPC